MEITSATYIISSPGYKQCPPSDRPEYAFIGRSNVGKSSLINMLTNIKGLAKISNTPGKTQLLNHYAIVSTLQHIQQVKETEGSKESKETKAANKGAKNWYLVDLPGYGYATVSQKARHNWSNMIESYIRKRENLVCLFVLIDSRHEAQSIDLEFINQLGEWEIPFVLVFTKSDKNKPGATVRNVEKFLAQLGEKWEEPPPYFITSATKKTGRKELLDYIGGLNRSFTKL